MKQSNSPANTNRIIRVAMLPFFIWSDLLHTELKELSSLLQDEIFHFLLQNTQTKLHHLFSHLKQIHLLHDLDTNAEQNLFKHNFIVMNALYHLQQDAKQLGYGLIIDSIDISLKPYQANQLQQSDNKLAAYYLDFTNINVTNSEIDTLLNHFWQHYIIHKPIEISKLKKARSVLGVPEDATLKQLKKSWHQFALNNHPDKTADSNSAQFNVVYDAYKLLLQHYKRQRQGSS